MKNLFNSIQLKKPKHNRFDLTHDVKMSGKMGNLMPCCVMPCIPGDRFNIGSDLFIRFAPLIAPVMHRMDATVHYFFVPYRILWDNFEKWIVNEPTGGIPTIELNASWSADEERLGDYLGFPPFSQQLGTPAPKQVAAFPFAAYQAIYNEYYRDQNLVPEVDYKLVDGLNPKGDLATLRKRAWMHDYFTAALPFAQKGTAVDIPLGDVILKDSWTGNPHFEDAAGTVSTGAVSNNALGPEITVGPNGPQAYNPDGTLATEPTTINDLRRAFKLQEWLERNARGGTRYIEHIFAHFGKKSSDARLQRPEYITGVKSPVVVSEVLNTTGEQAGLPQGNMAGHAVSVGSGSVGYYDVEEHGVILGIASIMPIPAYMQGIQKEWLKTQPEELFYPTFAHLGEQEVLQEEIFAYQPTGNDVFGYVPRYAEYKYVPNRVAGDFRNTLDYWHLGRIFNTPPPLSQGFIECDPSEVDRIFAVQDGSDNLYIQCLNKVSALRQMPVYGTPML